MKKEIVQQIFNKEATNWVAHSYEGKDGTYPTALHRVRIASELLSALGSRLKIADLGAGGGELAIELATQGHYVTGVDQSKAMIDIANAARAQADTQTQSRVRFQCSELEKGNLPENAFDAVTSMGVIGYLDADRSLFREAHRLLKPGGTFLLSCRNRLFNLNSLTHRTLREFSIGNGPSLFEEVQTCYRPLSKTSIDQFTDRLESLDIKVMAYEKSQASCPILEESPTTDRDILEARQHTPEGITKTAQDYGFEAEGFIGVHPHLIDPHLKHLLPAGLFDSLSSCLLAFERQPISLVWSSVFIAEFKKV